MDYDEENQDILCEIISILPFKSSSRTRTEIITPVVKIQEEGKEERLELEYRFKIIFQPFPTPLLGSLLQDEHGSHGSTNLNAAFSGILFHNVALNIFGISALNFLLMANKNLLVDYGFDISGYFASDAKDMETFSDPNKIDPKRKVGSVFHPSSSNMIRDIMADQDFLRTLCTSSNPINLASKLLLSQLVKVSIKSGKQKLDIIVNSLDLMFGMNSGCLNSPGTDGNSSLKMYLKRELNLAFPAAQLLLEKKKKRKMEEMMEREKKIDRAFF